MSKKNEEKKKKVLIPGSLRQRLMAAISMLLVATVLLVSATYAWFTLSTAPEVTGITTSVGANGNLEIALLTTDTYADTTAITSNTGDSMAVKAATDANITWGNLVDLSDSSYGLSEISLMPASINTADGKLVTDKMLQTPVYGNDGRVSSVTANTVSAIKDGSSFKYESASGQAYGVRAVGVASGLTQQQLDYNSYKTANTSAKNLVASATKTPVGANATTFATIAMNGGEAETYTKNQATALYDIALGVQKSLNNIVKAYANAMAASAVSALGSASGDAYEVAQPTITALAATTDAAKFTTVETVEGPYASLTFGSATITPATIGFTTADALVAQQKAVAEAIATLTIAKGQDSVLATAPTGAPADYVTADALNTAVQKLMGTEYVATDKDGVELTSDADKKDLDKVKKINLTGGALQAIANEVGAFEIADMLGIKVIAGAADTVGKLASATIGTAPAGANSSVISDFYGYALDFAFRTNAAESNLQLQTAAANRVYADETATDLATFGAGSNVTFTYSEGLAAAQAEKLLGALKFVFFDPADGTIYANGKLDTVTSTTAEATADIIIDGTDTKTICALTQNEVKKLSVLVYIDGTNIDNTAVINAASSGTLKVNLQFSSSATLVPMNNTALKQATK